MEKKSLKSVKSPSIQDAINGSFFEKKSYSDKLKNPLWQRKRLEIMQRDNFSCTLCGDQTTTLNIHHIAYSNKEPWEVDSLNLTTLCEHCHKEIEILKANGKSNFYETNLIKTLDKNAGRICYFIRYENEIMFRAYNLDGSIYCDMDVSNRFIDILNILREQSDKFNNFRDGQ